MTGLIARMDKSGLGIQSSRLARLLKPDKIMLIDSTPFNGNQQHPDWYKDYQTVTISGFPTEEQITEFVKGLDTVISCETFYHNGFTHITKAFPVKTVLIANPEFFDWFKPAWATIPLPDQVVVPSEWMWDRMKPFNPTYLPTPIFEDEFEETREINFNLPPNQDPYYLFINGKSAVHDRNGLESLYSALELSTGSYTVVVKSQDEIKKHPDPRLEYDFTDPDDPSFLYAGFDALILPRRYGGQSLPMSEALTCGLPVIMPDVGPNNKILPSDWLVPATKTGEFMARTPIDIYSSDAKQLALALDTQWLWASEKKEAFKLSKQYNAEVLRPKYEELLSSLS